MIKLDALLPLPIKEAGVMVIGDAIGTFVAWPTNLIDLVSMVWLLMVYIRFFYLIYLFSK